MENEPILKKTLKTVAIMVGGCVIFVGSLSAISVAIVSHAVAPATEGTSADVAPSQVHGDVPRDDKNDSHKPKPATSPRTPHPI